MNIKIKYEGSLKAVDDVKSTKQLEDKINNFKGVENVEVLHRQQLSMSTPEITMLAIGAISVSLQLAQFIYNIIQNKKSNITVNQQIVNINVNDSVEEIKLKLEMTNKQ